MVQGVNHGILLFDVGIKSLQRFKFVHVERGETIKPHRADVTARSLHPQYRYLFLGERIGHRDLGGGVATAKIGDAQIRTEKIGTVEKQTGLIQAGGLGIIPERWNGNGIAHGAPILADQKLRARMSKVNHTSSYCVAVHFALRQVMTILSLCA